MKEFIIILFSISFTFIISLLTVKLLKGDFDKSYYPVWHDKVYWDIKDDLFGNYETSCWYEISFSPKRKKYRLRLGGHKPKSHKYYGCVILKLNEFISKSYPQ